jgi:hypothetical protein
LFKHCCYCFVRWTIYHLSVRRKVNRQYKYHLSCTMHYHRHPYRRTYFTESWKIITGNATITDDFADGLRPLVFHIKLKNIYWKCHNHRWLCRRTTIRQHFTESWKNITGNATITDDVADGFQSFGMLSVGQNYQQNNRRTVRIPKGGALNASLTTSICRQNYRRILEMSPTE